MCSFLYEPFPHQPTKKGPSQPVVSCCKDPCVGVEGQEQGGYTRWHAEVLAGIEQSEEVVFYFEFFCSTEMMLLNQDCVEIDTFVVGIEDARQRTILQLVPSLWWSDC